MLNNEGAAYALVAMYEIARRHPGVKHPPCVRADGIAATYKLPRFYLRKVMSQLANAELLDSVKGPHGGFLLNRPMKDITFYEIFKAVGVLRPMDPGRNLVKGMPRPVQTVLNHVGQEAVASVKELLLGITLADLFKSK